MRTIKKSFIIISLLAVVIAIPLTVFISQQQQEIRQRASGREAAVFFAELGNTSPTALSQISLSPGQQKIIALYLDTGSISINGYDIIINFGAILQSVTVNEVAEGADANKFDSLIFKDFDQTTGKIRFARTNINVSQVIKGKLHLGSVSFTAKSDASGTGTIDIAYAEIISPGRDKLTVDLSPLPLAIGGTPPSPTAAPTVTVAPTLTPTSPPAPTAAVTSSYQECWVYLYSDGSCANQIGGYPAECSLNNPFANKQQGQCYSVSGRGNERSEKVAYCNACSPVEELPPAASQPTVTPTPTPTFVPGSTTVKLKTGGAFGLGTIFKLSKDTAPFAKKDQSLSIFLYKSTDDPLIAAAVTQSAAILSYNTAQNKFANEHAFNFTGSIPTGTYKILLKSPKYLRKNIGSLTVASGGLNTFDLNSNITLADGAGDVNNDNVLDIADYNVILACFGDKTCVNKEAADLNEDGKVDGIDINIFITGLSFTSRKGD